MDPNLYAKVLFGPDCCDRVTAGFVEMYKGIYDHAWAQYTAMSRGTIGDAPELVVVHSHVSRPMNVRNDDHDLIIYDQHLGEMLSMMARLVVEEASALSVDAHLYKLYAQRLLGVGRIGEAAWFAYGHLELSDLLQKETTPERDPARTRLRQAMVGAQEDFVIRHELAHTALRRSPSLREAMIELSTGLLRDGIEQFAPVDEHVADPAKLDEAIRNEYIADIVAAHNRNNSGDLLSFDEVRRSGAWDKFTFPKPRTFDDLSKIVEEDPVLADEFLCDLMAIVTISHPQQEQSEISLKMVGSVAALHGLRALQHLDAKMLDPNKEAIDPDFWQALNRLDLLRTALRALLYVVLAPGDREFTVSTLEAVASWNRGFARHINDQILFHFKPDIDRGDWPAVLRERVAALAANRSLLKSALGVGAPGG